MALNVVRLIEQMVTGDLTGRLKLIESLATAPAATIRRQTIRSVLPGLLRRGVSKTASLEGFREVGLGIRTTDFYNIEAPRAERKAATEAYISRASPEETIDWSWSHPADYNYGDRLNARVKIFGRDAHTGRFTTRYITVGAEEGETFEDIAGRAQERYDVVASTGRSPQMSAVFAVEVTDLETLM